jgi:hypothetical protein
LELVWSRPMYFPRANVPKSERLLSIRYPDLVRSDARSVARNRL